MAAELITLPVEVRAVDDEQRRAVMLVCRYGETSSRTARPERFARGAFTRSVTTRADRIPFTDRHTGGTGELRAPAVARPVQWDTSGEDELLAALKFYDTPEGWEMYRRARDGEIDAGSVGFQAVAERTVEGVREITEAALHHVALISRAEATPAYDGPRLLEVRVPPADVAALLAVTYDPELADSCVSAAYMARMVHDGGRAQH
jgi:HK97 family phage prohead protease